MKPHVLLIGGLAVSLLGLCLILTIGGSANVGIADVTGRRLWRRADSAVLFNRPTLDEVNRRLGSDGTKAVKNDEIYVWYIALDPGDAVSLTARFGDDGKLVYFKRVERIGDNSRHHSRWETGNYSAGKWEYSESEPRKNAYPADI